VRTEPLSVTLYSNALSSSIPTNQCCGCAPLPDRGREPCSGRERRVDRTEA
jgi:hypothetical protein